MIPRYATIIRSLLANTTDYHVNPARPINRALSDYWSNDLTGMAPLLDRFQPAPHLPASQGETIALSAWAAVALRTHTPQAHRVIESIAAAQQPPGNFFLPTPSDNLESLWYHELVLLHALTTYALVSNSPALIDSAKRAALYHLQETQPDHATTDPWSLNAFLLSPETYPLADQLLHTLQTQHPAGIPGLPAILLADTLRTLPP